jgi:hypothetical protein
MSSASSTTTTNASTSIYAFESSATSTVSATSAGENSTNTSKEARKAAYNASTVESNTREAKALEERIQLILIMIDLARDYLGHDSVGKSAVAVSRQRSVAQEIPPLLAGSNASVVSPASAYTGAQQKQVVDAPRKPPPVPKNRRQKLDKNGDTKSHHQSRSATSILMAKTDKSEDNGTGMMDSNALLSLLDDDDNG